MFKIEMRSFVLFFVNVLGTVIQLKDNDWKKTMTVSRIKLGASSRWLSGPKPHPTVRYHHHREDTPHFSLLNVLKINRILIQTLENNSG